MQPLTKKQQKIFKFIEDRLLNNNPPSQREIADILDISVSNVKVRLHRARKRFRLILEEHCRFEVDERSVLVCDPKEEEQ